MNKKLKAKTDFIKALKALEYNIDIRNVSVETIEKGTSILKDLKPFIIAYQANKGETDIRLYKETSYNLKCQQLQLIKNIINLNI